jgi:hypothetical protein
MNAIQLATLLTGHSQPVCMTVGINIGTNSGGGYTAQYSLADDGPQVAWAVDPADNGVLVQMYANHSAFSSQEIAGVTSLNGTITYTFGSNAADNGAAVVISLGIIINTTFDMHFVGIDTSTTSTNVVDLSGTFRYAYFQDDEGVYRVSPAFQVLNESGQSVGWSATAPVPVPADMVTQWQQTAAAAMIAQGGGLEYEISEILNGSYSPIDPDPFGPGL